jgi:hypothetical protein
MLVNGILKQKLKMMKERIHNELIDCTLKI